MSLFRKFILRGSKEAHGTLRCPKLFQKRYLGITKKETSDYSKIGIWPDQIRDFRDFISPHSKNGSKRQYFTILPIAVIPNFG